MEKNREIRRGGVVGKRHVSAARRSRASSGFKFPAAISNDDGDDTMGNNPSTSPILQDSRSKKHAGRMSPSLQEDDSCRDLDRSQNKRKRPGLQEPLNHLSASSAAVMDDNSDDTEMGRSEDDDDLPPPTVQRRPWKLKLHGKPREDLSPIDPAAVPRKLRTAMTKRQQESTSHLHVADIPKQYLQTDATTMFAPFSSSAAAAPSRKKKPDNLKPPTAKLAKTSSAKVSKAEVEVAETLYDLARMFTAEAVSVCPEKKVEPLSVAKSGSASSSSESDMKTSPAEANADVASPSSSLAQSQQGVSSVVAVAKKKHPRMSLETNDEELASVTDPCSSACPAVCLDAEKSHSQMETATSPKGGTSVSAVTCLMAASSSTKVKMENPVVYEAKITTEGNSNPPPMDIRSTSEPSEKLTILNSVVPVNVPNKGAELTEDLDKMEAIGKPELENRPLELAPKDGGLVNKFEIDLMAPPQGIDKVYEFFDSNMSDVKEKEQALPDYHKGNDNSSTNINNAIERNEVDMTTIHSAEIALADKERQQLENSKNIELEKEVKQPIGSPVHHKCNDWTTENVNGLIKESYNKTDALKDRVKQEVVQQTLNGTVSDFKQDAVISKSDSNASVKCITTSSLKGMPSPASVAGCSGGFPPLGYYSTTAPITGAAVASTWPTTLSVTVTSSSENSRMMSQLPSYPFPRQQSRKRCATHVYISNFIDRQQHMKPNSLWTFNYGNPTVLYGKGTMGTPVSNTLEPASVGSLKEKEPIGAALAATNVNGAKEKKEPAFGLPVTVSTAASVSGSGTGTANVAVSNILVTTAMVSGGSSASTCSSSVSSIANGLLDGSVASAAVLQAQLLNSVIQQPAFPFPISTDPFGSAYGHLLPQQVSHVFSKHPFYDTHMVSQQLANTTSPSATQKQPKNSQGSFPSGSSQLQYQEAFTSQATLSLSGAASHQPKNLTEKNNTADSRSGKKQVPVVQRNIYNQHFTSLNSQPAGLTGCTAALPIISQDFSLGTNYGVKQTGKMKQHAQAQPLLSQQMPAQVQKQQKAYLVPQYQMTASGLQTDLNEFDSRVSQSPLNRGSIGLDLVGIPGVASIMTSQGELLQSMPDLARGHPQSQNSIQNQTSSGQLHQYSTHVYHDQKMHQRQHALMERVGTANTAESGRTTNEGIYGKFGHEENQKDIKCELDQPNVLRFEWDSSRNMPCPQINTDPKRGTTVNSNVISFSEGTAGKLSTRQGIHIPSQNVNLGSQVLRHGHVTQDSGQLKTNHVASAGSLLAAASSSPPQAMHGATNKLQGQQSRSEQPAMNSVSARITNAPSISSSASTTSPLPSLHLVSKSGVGAPTKNSVSVKDSHSSQQRSPILSTSAKGVSAANMVSVLVPGQNHYGIQQHARHPQPVLQNYHQSNKHPSTQQQHLQFGQHILIHQPFQYDARTQSPAHSQPMSQQSTLHHQQTLQQLQQSPGLHHQQTLQQLQQSPGQTASLTQQFGSIQQQHIKHLQPVLTMPYGVSAIGNLPHNAGAVDAGNVSRSIVSDGGKSTAKSTGDTSSKTSCNERPTHSHNHISAVSSLQHVSSSNTVPVSYPNSLSQAMPNTVAVEKLSEKTNQ